VNLTILLNKRRFNDNVWLFHTFFSHFNDKRLSVNNHVPFNDDFSNKQIRYGGLDIWNKWRSSLEALIQVKVNEWNFQLLFFYFDVSFGSKQPPWYKFMTVFMLPLDIFGVSIPPYLFFWLVFSSSRPNRE
jgi:hypothetical protein